MHTVPTLPELQHRFLDALYDDAAPGPIETIAGNGLEPSARLRIYRHSCDQIQTGALRAAYPAVLALVGTAFFDQTAHGYRHAYPSGSGNLQDFGAGFADYLASLSSLDSYPYLPDVARLEWRRQLAALASDAVTVDAALSADVAMASPERLTLRLHPSVQLLSSHYAVLTLWQWCQDPSATPPAADASEQVLLWRDGSEVAMAALDPATFRCIDMLAAGHDVPMAQSAAYKVDNAFHLESCLRDLLAQGLAVPIRNEEAAF